jgi:hypothetical protein
MIDSLLDWLIYGLVFVGYLVFNYITARRGQRERERPLPSQAPANTGEIEEDPYAWGRSPVTEPTIVPWVPPPAPRDPSPAAPAAVPRSDDRAVRIRSQLRGTQGLRDAIVLMTVLGPCVAERDRQAHPTSKPRSLQ